MLLLDFMFVPKTPQQSFSSVSNVVARAEQIVPKSAISYRIRSGCHRSLALALRV